VVRLVQMDPVEEQMDIVVVRECAVLNSDIVEQVHNSVALDARLPSVRRAVRRERETAWSFIQYLL